MGLEDILQKICSAGDADVEKVRQEAQKQVAMIMEKLEKDVLRLKKDHEVSIAGEIRELENQLLSGARGAIQRATLDVKRKMIEEVFQKALEKAVSFDDETYLAYLEKVLLSLGVSGQYTLVMNSRDSKRVAEKIVRIAKEKTGGNLSLTLSKSSRDIAGGFVLQGAHMEINASIDAAFAQMQRSMESEIAQWLFGEQGK